VNEQDKKFMATFSMVLGALVVLAVFLGVVADIVYTRNHKVDDSMTAIIHQQQADRVKPVGEVAVVDPNAPPPAAKAPEEVIAQVCGACHNSGAAGAPKIGDKAAWESRMAQGFDALVSAAIQGKNAMPAKGGNPSLSDDEIKGAVKLMLEKSEIAVDAGSAPAAEAAAAAASAPAAGDAVHGKTIYDQLCMACHTSGAAGAPKLGDKAAWEPRVALGFAVLTEHAIKGINAMPAKGGNPALSDQDVADAVAYLLESVK
jgi:cytochrome c5